MAFVPITDPKRARAFYRDTLGLPLASEDPFALVFQLHGTTLRAAIVKSVSPAPYTVLGWEVQDIVRTAQSLQAAGIEMALFPGMPQDELGIWTSPSGARVAWFRDPDGSVLSISQHTP